MNLSLAALAFLIVLFGVAVDFYPLSIVGLFILIAALLIPTRPPPKPQPASQGTYGTPARVTPRAAPAVTSPAPQPEPQMASQYSLATMPPAPREGYTSTMPLFPYAMFPSMFPSMSPVPVAPQLQAQKQPAEAAGSTSDLVEMAAIVVLLKMLSG